MPRTGYNQGESSWERVRWPRPRDHCYTGSISDHSIWGP